MTYFSRPHSLSFRRKTNRQIREFQEFQTFEISEVCKMTDATKVEHNLALKGIFRKLNKYFALFHILI